MIKLKNVRDMPEANDGERVLIERLWPLDVDVYLAKIHLWLRDLAPSYLLLEWYRDHSKEWSEFEKFFRVELREPQKKGIFQELIRKSRDQDVTLLYSGEDSKRSAAYIVYREIQGG